MASERYVPSLSGETLITIVQVRTIEPGKFNRTHLDDLDDGDSSRTCSKGFQKGHLNEERMSCFHLYLFCLSDYTKTTRQLRGTDRMGVEKALQVPVCPQDQRRRRN